MPATSATTPLEGDADLAAIGSVLADRARCRILLALADGRALPAGVLADEAGVAASTASSHLGRLVDTGLVTVTARGRYRYYSLAGSHVGELIETVGRLAPSEPVRSLRQGTRAHALRRARSCYDHLAGRLGVQVTRALIDRGVLAAADGIADTRRRPGDRLASQLTAHPYTLGPGAGRVLADLGVPAAVLAPDHRSRRPLLRFCVDWSEQHHHLAGRLGAEILTAMTTAGWITRLPRQRAVRVTPAGERALREHLGISLGAPPP
jgi:DNA-binding transcriptional ArsR family regulator